MHILYIHQYFATPRGNTGTRSYEFARRWVAAGHRVTMLTSVAQMTEEDLGGPPKRLVTRLQIDGIDIVALNVRYRQSMGIVRRVWAFVRFMMLATWTALRVKHVDKVYATSTPLTVGIPALAGWWLRRRAYVFEVRDVWPAVPIAMGVIRNRLLIRLLLRLERTIYRGAQAIVALSPGMEACVRERVDAGKRVVTVPNCADTDLFSPEIDGGRVRSERGWGDRFVCIHTGAMGRANALDVIVEAATRFRDDPDHLFVLVGEGSEKKRLQDTRDELDLKNLQIIDGQPKHELPALVAAADACLVTFAAVPILQDNSANKLFDYLAAGRPVIVNYGGWQREVLEDAKAGLGSTQGDNSSFFANIAALHDDPALRRTMGERARTLAVERYERSDLAERALDLLLASE